MTDTQPLSGIRVLEMCGWDGVLAGRLLADAGADVVRIVPTSGDPLAADAPFFGDSGRSIQEAWYNAGKRIVTIDPRKDAAELERLVVGADILIEDWRQGEGPMDSGHLASLNEALVRVSVTPFGRSGPWSGYLANDLVANALSGGASVTGMPDTPPISGFGNQSHNTVGMYAAIVAMAALRARDITGKGTHVDLSAHEALVSCTEQLLMEYFFPNGGAWQSPIARRQGGLHWSNAYATYPAKIGHGVMITAALNFAGSLLPWMLEENAAQELADQEKYPDVVSMIRNLPYVMQILREWVGRSDSMEMFLEAQRRHQPFGAVLDIAQAASTPQIEARGYFQDVDIPGAGKVAFAGRFFRTSGDGPRPAPSTPAGSPSIDWPPRSLAHTGTTMDPARPLEGVRILDFTHVLAGPFATRVLGDMGAQIIKVGTSVRGAGANSLGHPYYVMWNRNKQSLSLNMGTPEGRATARKLAAECDVIIENFSAGVLKRWGLDKAGMADANPGLTVVSMGGMGQSGPWSNFVTFAPTIHALCGLTYMTNPPGEHLMGYGFALTDHLSGLIGAVAVLEGLEHRKRTGHGLDVDLSQYEVGLGIMAPALIEHRANGVNPEPVGNRHPYGSFAPHNMYPCAGEDRWVAIAVQGDDQWRWLCQAIGQPFLAADPRFATHADRCANEDELDALISEWTATRDRYEVMHALQAAGVPAGAVQDASDLTSRDAQNASRALFGTLSTGHWGEHGFDRFPATFNGDRPSVYEATRETGSDTFDILSEVLGLGDEEIGALAEAGALT